MALFDALRGGMYMGVPSGNAPQLTNLANYIQFIPQRKVASPSASGEDAYAGTAQHREALHAYDVAISSKAAEINSIKTDASSYEAGMDQHAQLSSELARLEMDRARFLSGAKITKEDVDAYVGEIEGDENNSNIILDNENQPMVNLEEMNRLSGVKLDMESFGTDVPIVNANAAFGILTTEYKLDKEEATNLISKSYATYTELPSAIDRHTGIDNKGQPFFSQNWKRTLPTGSDAYRETMNDIKTGITTNITGSGSPIGDDYDVLEGVDAVLASFGSVNTRDELTQNQLQIASKINALVNSTDVSLERGLREMYFNGIQGANSEISLNKGVFKYIPLTFNQSEETGVQISPGKDINNFFSFTHKIKQDNAGNYLVKEKDEEGNFVERAYNPETDDLDDLFSNNDSHFVFQNKTQQDINNDYSKWKRLQIAQDISPESKLITENSYKVSVGKTATGSGSIKKYSDEENLMQKFFFRGIGGTNSVNLTSTSASGLQNQTVSGGEFRSTTSADILSSFNKLYGGSSFSGLPSEGKYNTPAGGVYEGDSSTYVEINGVPIDFIPIKNSLSEDSNDMIFLAATELQHGVGVLTNEGLKTINTNVYNSPSKDYFSGIKDDLYDAISEFNNVWQPHALKTLYNVIDAYDRSGGDVSEYYKNLKKIGGVVLGKHILNEGQLSNTLIFQLEGVLGTTEANKIITGLSDNIDALKVVVGTAVSLEENYDHFEEDDALQIINSGEISSQNTASGSAMQSHFIVPSEYLNSVQNNDYNYNNFAKQKYVDNSTVQYAPGSKVRGKALVKKNSAVYDVIVNSQRGKIDNYGHLVYANDKTRDKLAKKLDNNKQGGGTFDFKRKGEKYYFERTEFTDAGMSDLEYLKGRGLVEYDQEKQKWAFSNKLSGDYILVDVGFAVPLDNLYESSTTQGNAETGTDIYLER